MSISRSRVTVPRVIRDDSRNIGDGILPEVLEQAKKETKKTKEAKKED